MESWMVSFVIALVGVIAGYAVMKYQVAENKRQQDQQWDRLDSHYKTLLEHEGKIKTKPNMEEIRKVFVEIKMWELQNKHMDEKLDHMEKSVLDKLEEIKTAVCPIKL